MRVWAAGSVAEYASEVTEEDFVQARVFWGEVLGRQEGQQEAFVGNVAAHLSKAKPEVWEGVFGKCMLLGWFFCEWLTDELW